jgi:hypothetical protein
MNGPSAYDVRSADPMRLSKIATAVFVGISITGCGTASPTASHPNATSSLRASTSQDPRAACASVEPEGKQFEITVETVSFAFDTDRIEGPRHCQPFAITFKNHDVLGEVGAGLTNQHDIDIRAGVLGPKVFDGKLIPGPAGAVRYEVPGLPAGEYVFFCSVHHSMKGTLAVAEH